MNEDTYKEKIAQLKEQIKSSQNSREELDHLRKKSLTLIERNKALRTQIQKLQDQLVKQQQKGPDVGSTSLDDRLSGTKG